MSSIKMNARIGASDVITDSNNKLHIVQYSSINLPNSSSISVFTRKKESSRVVTPRKFSSQEAIEPIPSTKSPCIRNDQVPYQETAADDADHTAVDSAGRRRPAAQPLRDSSDEDGEAINSAFGFEQSTETVTSSEEQASPLSPTSDSSSTSGPTYCRPVGFQFHAHHVLIPPKRQQNKAQRLRQQPLDSKSILPHCLFGRESGSSDEGCVTYGQIKSRIPPSYQPLQRRNFLQAAAKRDIINGDPIPMRARNLPASFYQCPNQPPAYSPALGILPKILPPLLSSVGIFSSGKLDDGYRSRVYVKDAASLNKLFDKCKVKDTTCKISLPVHVARKLINEKNVSFRDSETTLDSDVDTQQSLEEEKVRSYLLHQEAGSNMLPQLKTPSSTSVAEAAWLLLPQLAVPESERNALLLSEMVASL